MSTTETRNYQATETRVASDDKGITLTGHAAVFGSQSFVLPPERGIPRPFREVIAPGAFRDTLANEKNIYALVNHDKNKVLGSTRSGTLSLAEDVTGLAYVLSLPNTSYANDLAELCRRGDVTTCSFAFIAEDQAITDGEEGIPLRRLDKVSLKEISLGVADPAYGATTCAVRSVENYLNDKEREAKRARIEEILKIMDI